MKCLIRREEFRRFQWILLTLLTISFYGCKDDDESSTMPYDPHKPVVVTGFTPTEGSTKTRMVVSDSNFGTDHKIITVRINGMKAPVINAKRNSLYCMVPYMYFVIS